MPNVNEPEWKQAIRQCKEILDSLGELPDEAESFADSVRDKVTSIREWIRENEHVTPKQIEALDNMESGVGRWMK